MKKYRFLVITAAALLAASCMFISAKSNFYLTNDSTGPVTVKWTSDLYDSSGSKTIAAGATEKIASGTLLEADSMPPSQFFSKIEIYADGESITPLYSINTDPGSDELWLDEPDGFRSRAWTISYPAQ